MERKGLGPIVGDDSKVLVLGTFPGEESLRQCQYYADRRNQFWDIMGEAFGARRDIEYGARKAVLTRSGIAVWDVLESCAREGSSDSKIRRPYTPNDFNAFVSKHRLECIFFNGKKAHEFFLRLVAPKVTLPIPMRVLCSTAGANTHYSKDEKIKEWLDIKRCL